MQEQHDDTREGEDLAGAEVRFDQGDAEAVGDPAAASVEAEGAAAGGGVAGEAESGGWEPPGEQSPAAADRRGAEQAESPPFIPIAGAFVGAFVAAKLLGKLGGGND
jgi:hypothetical protein